MALTPCDDISAAAWIASSDAPLGQLVTFGPPGFEAYARLRFLPDPVYTGQPEAGVKLGPDMPSEHERLAGALSVLGQHTRTSDDCYFCLWDGWGSQIDGDAASSITPAFPPSVLNAPKVVIPSSARAAVPLRRYLLFHGSLSQFGDWGAADWWPGQPRSHMPDPAFIWPADHAWCVANDVDPHYAGIGASPTAIAGLLAYPGLDVVLADPHGEWPRYS